MKTLLAVTTVDSLVKARTLARELVERRLVACAQISEIQSVFIWDNAVQDEPEFRLVLKTTEARYPALEQTLADLHPYDVPAIFSVEPEDVYEPFARWVDETTRR